MDSSQKRIQRNLYFLLSISVNLGLLFYFKYSNFFIDNFNEVLLQYGIAKISWTKLVLPIGISFYTFETITYVVDVYRKVHKPQSNFWNYQLYIIFFPKLIAGPIVRYHEFADQITKRFYSDSMNNRIAGFTRFSLGLSKKVLLANPCGSLADQILSLNYHLVSSGSLWIGILAYTMQIYFDFSGYSDMAIGLSRMMGFKIPENFKNPYTSRSITDFWRRWHITLGAWMKNYLYIPLGGNKVQSKSLLYRNLMLVFLASGLWHGASWNFIFWGAFHGFFLVLERVFLLKIYSRISSVFTIPLNFLIVMVGWVYFRIESFSDANLYIRQMFAFKMGAWPDIELDKIVFLLIAIAFSFFSITNVGSRLELFFYSPSLDNQSNLNSIFIVGCLFFILSLSFISASGFNPFIFFRF